MSASAGSATWLGRLRCLAPLARCQAAAWATVVGVLWLGACRDRGPLTEPAVPVASVTVSPRDTVLIPGESVRLTASPMDATGNVLSGRLVTWSSSDPAVAAVDSAGLVTGVSEGSATVTAVVEQQRGTATITLRVLSVTKIGEAQTATVGSAVATPPAVLVQNAYQEPIPGESVTFRIVSGGGKLAGELATTDQSGVATLGTWTLGRTAGTNTLTASVRGLSPVTFTATGTAGPAAAVTKQAGDGVTGRVGSAVDPPPSVLVSDEYGNAVSGATVTFVVASGGGSIDGFDATSQRVTTGAGGAATVLAWFLGAASGDNTMTATVSGLPEVTFTATATAAPPPSSRSKPVTTRPLALGPPKSRP